MPPLRRRLGMAILRTTAAALALAVLLSPPVRTQAPPPPQADEAARQARLEWFREAKYGLFIHWGLYAVPAGEWKGERIPGIGEWIMLRARVPVKEYEQLAKQFNPVKFNAADPEHPDFQVMVRAAKHEPDYYYTNEVLRELKSEQRKGLGL